MLALPLLACERPEAPEAAADAAATPGEPAAALAFEVDPYWPRPLPDDWLLGNVVGVATDSRDNVWIIHRPNSQRGAEATPPVIAFDPEGNVVHGWGGPGDGYAWGTQTHGIHVDHGDNVWVGFGGGLPYDLSSRATTDNAHVLKFTPDGDFLLQIGEFGNGTAGSGSTEFLGQPTDIFVDPETDEVYVSDGYTNRRVIVFDADTGEYRRHWGGYGDPPDDAPQPAFTRDGPLPRQFNTPHCVGRSADGNVYVCDRGNQRLQVFEPDATFADEALSPPPSEAPPAGRPGTCLLRDADQRARVRRRRRAHAVHVLRRTPEVATFRTPRAVGRQFESRTASPSTRGHLFVGER